MAKFDFKLFEHLPKYFPKQELKLNRKVETKIFDINKYIEDEVEIDQDDWWQLGSNGDDLIHTSHAAMQTGQLNHIDAGEGSTIASGFYGNDRIVGDSRNNIIYGNSAYIDHQPYVDDLRSFTDYSRPFDLDMADDDYLTGGAGNDVLYGCRGDDVLIAGIGNDTLFGGTGNDFLDASLGRGVLKGGDGGDMFKINQSYSKSHISQTVVDMKDGWDRIKYGGEVALRSSDIRWRVNENSRREGASSVTALVGRRSILFSFIAMNGTSLAYNDKGIWVSQNTGDRNAMATINEGFITDDVWNEPIM